MLAGALLCVLPCVPAIAGTAIADVNRPPDFATIDSDSDGYISSREADSVPEIKRIFATVDNDRDGQLDTSEWSEAVARVEGLG
jgi:hypothetical protein